MTPPLPYSYQFNRNSSSHDEDSQFSPNLREATPQNPSLNRSNSDCIVVEGSDQCVEWRSMRFPYAFLNNGNRRKEVEKETRSGSIIRNRHLQLAIASHVGLLLGPLPGLGVYLIIRDLF